MILSYLLLAMYSLLTVVSLVGLCPRLNDTTWYNIICEPFVNWEEDTNVEFNCHAHFG